MKKFTFVASIFTIAALAGADLMFHTQSAEAKPLDPVMVADAGQGMNGMSMDGMDMKGMNKKEQVVPVAHQGTGTVKKIDSASGIVTLSHGPIPSLNWPAMTMSFKLKDAALAKGIKAGEAVDFELVQSGSDYVVTRLQPSDK